VFGLGIKARTSLAFVEIAMSAKCRNLIFLDEFSEEFAQRNFLSICACIFWLHALVDAADINNANRTRIMTRYMCADLVYWTTRMDGAISVDDEMIADVFPAVIARVPHTNGIYVYITAFG